MYLDWSHLDKLSDFSFFEILFVLVVCFVISAFFIALLIFPFSFGRGRSECCSYRPVTGDVMTSRNTEYEKRMRDKGLKKITIWVPESSAIDFQHMASFCCSNQDCFPFMARSSKTGRMVKVD